MDRIETLALPASLTVSACLKRLGRQSMKCIGFALGTIFLVMVTFFSGGPASAATIPVTSLADSGPGSLRAAIAIFRLHLVQYSRVVGPRTAIARKRKMTFAPIQMSGPK
jgi:hypothetical protein